MLVSLQSLGKFYSGPVTIASEDEPPDWFREISKTLGASIIRIAKTEEYVLAAKSRMWQFSPFDQTLFLDADTIVLGPIDEAFRAIERKGCIVTRFNDWHTHRGRMRARVEAWGKVDKAAVQKAKGYQWAINTGVIGWARGSSVMPAYESMTRRGLAAGGIPKKTLDEIAMQLVVPGLSHELLGKEWNISPVFGTLEGGKIIHYHGHKHCRAGVNFEPWKDGYKELVARFPGYRKELVSEHCDDSVAKWIAEESGLHHDVTIVTAVNPQYADKARRNVEKWLATPGLAGNRFLCFVNGFANSRERAFLKHPNITVVKWDYPFAATPRERMLAAFVLGVAAHVKTDYWMKLDADATPIKPFEWPDYCGSTIVSHKWGYTKMKGDPEAKEHWFNRLDSLYSPNAPYFKRRFDVKSDFQVGHRPGNKDGLPMRFGSFCHIEKTKFTKRMADVIRKRNGGRLPIPSQDTLAWYCASLWKEPVKLVNMKEWFSP